MPDTKQEPANKKTQKKNNNANEEEPNPTTSNASDDVSAAVRSKKQTLKEMIIEGIKFLTDRDVYSSLQGVERYLREEKDFDANKNHARIKTTLHDIFKAEIIKQKDPKKQFSVSVQFVMNNKKKATSGSIAKRKSIQIAKKKKKQNDAKEKKSKKTVKLLPITNVETDDDDAIEYSDDEDVPILKLPVKKRR